MMVEEYQTSKRAEIESWMRSSTLRGPKGLNTYLSDKTSWEPYLYVLSILNFEDF